METQDIPYKKHIIVCVNRKEEGSCCFDKNSEAIRDKLKEFVKEKKINKIVRVSSAKCLGQCSTGPTVMIYPDNIWYSHTTLEDADKIIKEHIEQFVKEKN